MDVRTGNLELSLPVDRAHARISRAFRAASGRSADRPIAAL